MWWVNYFSMAQDNCEESLGGFEFSLCDKEK